MFYSLIDSPVRNATYEAVAATSESSSSPVLGILFALFAMCVCVPFLFVLGVSLIAGCTGCIYMAVYYFNNPEERKESFARIEEGHVPAADHEIELEIDTVSSPVEERVYKAPSAFISAQKGTSSAQKRIQFNLHERDAQASPSREVELVAHKRSSRVASRDDTPFPRFSVARLEEGFDSHYGSSLSPAP